jgi:serine phosphatase RsbU (regulator of sigma subunit)
MQNPDTGDTLEHLTRELENFQDIARYLLPQPGEVPRLNGIDVWGGTTPLRGSVGGDHIIYVDFKQRFDLDARLSRARQENRTEVAANLQRLRRTAGIAVIDVAGHRVTDALLAAMLHQAFLVGALYELDQFGQVTRHLFEHLNSRFYQSSGAHKFISLIYGEISEDAKFRFLSAAHPFPSIFSTHHDRFMEVSPHQRVSFPPLGMMPSFDAIDRNATELSTLGFKDHYEMNEWWIMGAGDILLLHTDGVAEHARGGEMYFPHHLERAVRAVKHSGARQIYDAIMDDMRAFTDPSDDISLVVIKLHG